MFYNLYKIGLIIIILICFCPVWASGQNSDYSPSGLEFIGQKIVSIDYRGDGEFSREKVESETTIKVGDLYSRSSIRKSIEGIYSIGSFSDVEVDVKTTDDGLNIIFILITKIRVRSIELQGNENLKREKILQVMRLQVGRDYDKSIAEADENSIKELYKSQGYYNTQVKLDSLNIDGKTKEASLVFVINEGQRPVIKKIVFIGTMEAVISDKELLETMQHMKIGNKYKGQEVLRTDARLIEEKYRSKEYITAKVKTAKALSDKENVRKFTEESLFSIKNEYQAELDNLKISENLTKTFNENGVFLSPEAYVSIVTSGSVWIISDRGKKYIIRKHNDKLDISRQLGRHFPKDSVEIYSEDDNSVLIFMEVEQGRRVYIKIQKKEDGKYVGVDDEEEIKKSIAVNRMHSVTDPVLNRSAEDIRNVYRSKGYYQAEVNYSILNDKVWGFNNEDDTEGWTPENESTTLKVVDRILTIETADNKPVIISPEIRLDASIYRRFHIRMRCELGSLATVYWLTEDDKDKWKSERQVSFDIISGNQFRDYAIDIGRNKHWSKTIKQLKIEVSDKAGADAEISTINLTTEYIPVIFNVIENNKMIIRDKVTIKSATDEELEVEPENIRKQMLTRKKSFWSFWLFKKYFSSGILDNTILEADRKAIIAFYKDKGYTNVSVNKKINPKPEEEKIDVTLEITEGSKTLVTDIYVQGDNGEIMSNEEIFSNLTVITDFKKENIQVESEFPRRIHYKADNPKIFREEDTVADRSYLRTKYADEGYLYVQVEKTEKFSDDNSQVSITYNIDEGQKIRIDDEIEIQYYRIIDGRQVFLTESQAKTKPHIIKRELSKRLTEERVFSYTEIARSWQRIYDLGLFEGVKIDTKPVTGVPDMVKIIIEVIERNAISVNTHIGFSSNDNFRGGIEFNHRNLFGTARTMGGRIQIGTEGTRGEINYIEPKIFGSEAYGLTDIHRYSEENINYPETWTGGTVGIGHGLGRNNTFMYKYRYDLLDYIDRQDERKRTTNIGRVETTFRRDTRNNPLNPIDGWLHVLKLEHANDRLGGTETFTKITFDNTHYIPLPLNSVFALGIMTGWVRGLDEADLVLTPEQFQMDDYNVPRGYTWDKDDTSNVLLNTSIELRFPIYKWLGGAFFFDSGYIYNRIQDFDITEMKSSIGTGLRFSTPIGPIRIDYGYPIRGNGKRNYWPHFALGHAF
ncbi:BamA/TamA family outer membrane protein [Candidatus Poribacteria bacterium]|nr:BamA/TamA family outer membrane protein [Candidatus Poribacteria bacterium]